MNIFFRVFYLAGRGVEMKAGELAEKEKCDRFKLAVYLLK